MNKDVYEQLIKPRPYLWWWVSDKEKLSDEAVVEGVLANGDMDDVELLFDLFGKERVREIFLGQIRQKRHNYRPQTVNFFLKVFANPLQGAKNQDLRAKSKKHRARTAEQKKTAKYLTEEELVNRAVGILVEKLGPVEAARFMNLPRMKRIGEKIQALAEPSERTGIPGGHFRSIRA